MELAAAIGSLIGQVGRLIVGIGQDALCMALQRVPRSSQRHAARLGLEPVEIDKIPQISEEFSCCTGFRTREFGLRLTPWSDKFEETASALPQIRTAAPGAE